MNSHKDMNSSEYMNSHNDNNGMNSSNYENSYVPCCVFVPDEELDGLTNGHDKSNTLDDTSEMNIDTDCIDTDCINTNCIDTDHVVQICTVPIHMI